MEASPLEEITSRELLALQAELEDLAKNVPIISVETDNQPDMQEFVSEVARLMAAKGYPQKDIEQISFRNAERYSFIAYSLARMRSTYFFDERWIDKTESRQICVNIHQNLNVLAEACSLDREIIFQLAKEKLAKGISKDSLQQEKNNQGNFILKKIIDQEFIKYCHELKMDGPAHEYFPDYIGRAAAIRSKYDVGVAIAKGGLFASFMLHLAGLPIMMGKVKRTGRGATWVEKESFQGENLKNKRILLLENDVVTGRTLRRAEKEIERYSPLEIGVCFMENLAQCRYSRIPLGITKTFHLQDPTDNTDYSQVNALLAQRFDSKYHIFRIP